ncbi:PD-(D/E)XK nuclease family protein [Desulfurispirillum indicum]|uniref:PD-(D/E)XK nuclease family protein n=1 Tax=Desulfurispirillum indicum TaxID=936456 RepID=UPI001CFC373B|nr:PD-(D/E)XK nuclease family protein [Desulfurispirillum indicum]UCZ56618.1 PD-(D/E)XK nuclease family protein [Desulfurispirillum indicum]
MKHHINFLNDLDSLYQKLFHDSNNHQSLDAKLARAQVICESARQHCMRMADENIRNLKKIDPNNPMLGKVAMLESFGLSRKETAHTAFLSWVFNPRCHHGFNDNLAKALLRNFIQVDIDDEFSVDTSISEYYLSDECRIDVWVSGKHNGSNWLLIIEAKIDAKQNSEQLTKYSNHLRVKDEFEHVIKVFLTPNTNELIKCDEHWHHISFYSLYCILWKEARKHNEAEGLILLKHYLHGVLKNVLNWNLPISSNPKNPYNIIKSLQIIEGE